MKKYITSTPRIVGGRPVIAGTRIPVTLLLTRLKQGYTLKDLHTHWPHVSTKKLEKVLEELSTLFDSKEHAKALS